MVSKGHVYTAINCFLLSILIIIVSPAQAQNSNKKDDGLEKQSQALSRLKPERQIRLQVQDSGMIEGRFSNIQNDTLFLAGAEPASSIPLNAIDALWVRGRATKKGAVIGTISGGILGGVGGWLLSGFSHMDGGGEPISTTTGIITGTITGAAMGALLGTVIGASIPKWQRQYQSSNYDRDLVKQEKTGQIHPQDRTRGERRNGIGGAGLFLGYARGVKPDRAAKNYFGGRLNLYAAVHPNIAIGPELGYYGAGSTQSDAHSLYNTFWHAGGTFCLYFRRRGIRPLALIGLGYYSSNANFLGGTLGAGIQFRPGSIPHLFSLEVRGHGNLQRVGSDQRLITVMAGMMITW